MPSPPVFPVDPDNGDEYTHEDKTFKYRDPPGVWEILGNGLDEDLIIIAAANNGVVLSETTWPFTEERESDVTQILQDVDDVNNTLDDVAPKVRRHRTQVLGFAASGVTPIDLAQGFYIHVPETTGSWSPDFLNVPTDLVVDVYISINVSGNNHEMTIPNGVWKQGITAPVTGDWDIQEQMLIRAVKTPFIDKWVYEWLYNGIAPPTEPDPITPPTLTASYSISNNRTSPTSLSAATLPAGEVAVFFGPTGNADIESFRIFFNHTGGLPALGEEGDSFVRSTSTDPYDLLGSIDGLAIMWDTNVDPTGNNRSSYDPNGENTITIEATLTDGQTPSSTFTFNTSNAPLGSSPVRDLQTYAFNGGTSNATVTVPDGVDRVVLVKAWYNNGAGTVLSGLTLNGVTMTNIAGATRNITSMTGVGVYTAYLTEAQLSTGERVLSPNYTGTVGTYSSIIYQVEVITNVDTPSFGGIFQFQNTHVASMSPVLTSVPANSMLFTGCLQQDPTSPEMTVDTGVADTAVELSVNPKLEVRTAYLSDSGSAGNKTVTWTATGRQLCTVVYLDYVPSSGGSGETPIIPAVPVISSVSNAGGDNQLTVTWGSATDAVSYELRHGSSNPPTASVIAVTSPHIITGLAASVVRYVQVRSVSSTGDRSAWSSVASGTPTGSVTPPPVFGEKFIVADNAFDAAYSQGSGPMRFSDVYIPTTIRRYNPSSTENALANMAANSFLDDPINRWESRSGGNKTAYIDAMGPRLIWTSRLAPLAPRNHTKGTAAEAAAGVYDMGISGSKGTLNRDWVWQKVGNDVNRVYRGYNVWEMFFLSIAHESNGAWSQGYMGKDTKLIGQSLLTGATNAQFGSAMGAALRKAGATGECADVHRLACEHQYDIIQGICGGKAIIGMTPAVGPSSTPEDTTPSNLSTSWVWDAFPERPLDFICPTIYARGHGKMEYDGSGSIDDSSNWSFESGMPDHTLPYINDRYGCAGGFLETGGAYALPSTAIDTSGNNSQSDEGMRAFHEQLHDDWIPNSFNAGVAFVNHWTVLNWSASANPGTGCSFHILEGMWGNWPAGTSPTSTSKPAHSTVTSPRYTKTLQWFKDRF